MRGRVEEERPGALLPGEGGKTNSRIKLKRKELRNYGYTI
jgi:hypothetical protein